MQKKLIKELKHIHKIIQKKDKNKEIFEKINAKIFFSNFFTGFLILFFILIINFNVNIFILTLSIIGGLVFIIFSSFFNFFNFFIDKKFKKYDILSNYGYYENFNDFLKNFLIHFLNKSETEDIKSNIQILLDIINCIDNNEIKNEINIKIIEKIGICTNSIILNHINQQQENKKETENIDIEKIIKVTS